MASNTNNSDEIKDKTRSVHFGVAIEDDDPIEGGGGANRRTSLTKGKKFRETRSMRFSELNQVTGAVSLFVFIILYVLCRSVLCNIDIFAIFGSG